MPHLPTLADRVWFAYHCLPRDARGEPPSYRALETANGLPLATFSKTVQGTRTKHQRGTIPKVAKALKVSEHWLDYGGADGPTPTGMVPPRPGTKWMRHSDVANWHEAVSVARLDPKLAVPHGAFLAGGDMPVFRPLDRITPELAVAVARYAWETSTIDEQIKYSTIEGRAASAGQSPASGKHRARRPATK